MTFMSVPGGAGLVLAETQTVTSVATVEFTGLDNPVPHGVLFTANFATSLDATVQAQYWDGSTWGVGSEYKSAGREQALNASSESGFASNPGDQWDLNFTGSGAGTARKYAEIYIPKETLDGTLAKVMMFTFLNRNNNFIARGAGECSLFFDSKFRWKLSSGLYTGVFKRYDFK